MLSDTQREADAAHFEDWSQWAVLVYSPYGCELRGRRFWVDVPPFHTVCKIVENLPGAHRIPNTIAPGSYYVPAQNWRELRAALPAIETAIATLKRGRV